MKIYTLQQTTRSKEKKYVCTCTEKSYYANYIITSQAKRPRTLLCDLSAVMFASVVQYLHSVTITVHHRVPIHSNRESLLHALKIGTVP